jgi:hypothetical protein
LIDRVGAQINRLSGTQLPSWPATAMIVLPIGKRSGSDAAPMAGAKCPLFG